MGELCVFFAEKFVDVIFAFDLGLSYLLVDALWVKMISTRLAKSTAAFFSE